MKTRRHHNNEGLRQVRNGGCARSAERIAIRLGLRFRVGTVLRDYGLGRTEARQPGGVCYVMECADDPAAVLNMLAGEQG